MTSELAILVLACALRRLAQSRPGPPDALLLVQNRVLRETSADVSRMTIPAELS